MLVRWKIAMFLIITGTFSSIYFFKFYTGVNVLNEDWGSLQFKIVYVLLMVTSILIVLLKPKEEYLEATEKKVEYLEKEVEYSKREFLNIAEGMEFLENQFKQKEGKLKDKEIYLKNQLKLRNIEIVKLKDLKDEFIRRHC